MEFKKFNEIAELIGMVAIVASLIFVGLQLRQSQLIAIAEVEGAVASTSVEMANLISDNSEIWHRGISNEQMDASEAATFEGIVIALSDRAYSRQRQFRLLGDDDISEAVVHEFAACLHQRPGARRVWLEREAMLKKHRGILDPEAIATVSNFVEIINTDFAKLDQLED